MKKVLRENKKLVGTILFLIILEIVLFSVGSSKINLAIKERKENITQTQNILSKLKVDAQSISIYDVTDNEEIYNKNGDEFVPLASLTKTMTVLTALKKYKLDDEIVISENATWQDVSNNLFLGEKWKVLDLIKLALVGSLNDAALALSENDINFIADMNLLSKEIGLKNTVFLNPTGLDLEQDLSGVYSSSTDANTMAIYALKNYPEIFSITTLSELNLKPISGVDHYVQNTDTLLGKIPNLLFSKTGYTQLAGGNLTIIFKNNIGHQIAITILGSTKEGRFSDMENLVNILLSNYENRK